MVRKSKWIEDVSAKEPVADVAQRALEARLELVWHYLPKAAAGPLGELENVHQLRVATRRAMAAFDIFDSLLPGQRALWMTKQLKRVRQAAGDARDFDVFGQRLEKMAGDSPHAGLQFVVDRVHQERKKAQQPIEEIHQKLLAKEFPKRVEALVKRVRLRSKADKLSHPTFGAAARKALRADLEDFSAAAGADLSDYANLHGFRIQGKQLRYAMEVFAGAFPSEFRKEIYPLVESLQEKLGEINDHHTAEQLLTGWLGETEDHAATAALTILIEQEKAAMHECRRKFFEWWNGDRRSQLEGRLQELLANHKEK